MARRASQHTESDIASATNRRPAASAPARRRRAASFARGFHLQIEALEERRLLSVTPKDAFALSLGTTLTALAAEYEEYVDDFIDDEVDDEGNPVPPELSFQTQLPATLYSGSVVVDAAATTTTAALEADLRALGATITGTFGRVVSALVPLGEIETLATLGSLKLARAVNTEASVGSTTSQGDFAMGSDSVRNLLGIDGTGITVGVLSDSYNSLFGATGGVASGNLPGSGNPLGNFAPVNVLQDLPAFAGTDEGRAMLEIIHDVAPGASLSFATAFLGQASFARNIRDLALAGAKVIVDDVIYFAEPMFQDGIIAQAIDLVAQSGVSFFSAAGNSARNSYESAFRSGGLLPAGHFASAPGAPTFLGGVAHDFDAGAGVDILQGITLDPFQSINLSLQWDSPFFSVSGGAGSLNDVDIYVINSANQVVAASTDANIGGDAVELLQFANFGIVTDTFNIVIVTHSGANPSLIKYVNFDGAPAALEYDTQSSTAFGHTNASQSISVGAAAYFNTPNFGQTPPIPESFTSAGGIAVHFDRFGNRTSPQFRTTPDIIAPDSANTSFFVAGFNPDFDGFPNFPGTSAAAPHAAAVAALMLDLNPNLTPAQITSILQQTALDMDDPNTVVFDTGYDFLTGFGFIRATQAALAVGGTLPGGGSLGLGDRFEVNNDFNTATPVASRVDLDIDSLSIHTASDIDFFRYRSPVTGTLFVEALFNAFDGDLNVRIRDGFGNILANGVQNPADIFGMIDGDTVQVPVIAGQFYFIEVYAPSGDLNFYDLTIQAFGTAGPGFPVDDILVVAPDISPFTAGFEPVVRVLDPATLDERFNFMPYAASFRGGVRIAVGDVNGDGVQDVVTGAGPTGGPHIRVFDGRTGVQLPGAIGNFFAFETSYNQGVWVGAGDVDGDGLDDVIVGTDSNIASGGSSVLPLPSMADARVRVFSGATGSILFDLRLNSQQGWNGGSQLAARVGAADLDGDGFDEILIGTGPNTVHGWTPGGNRLLALNPRTGETLLTLNPFPGFGGGIFFTAGDVDRDGRADLIVSADSGGSPQVKVIKGSTGEELVEYTGFAGSTGIRVAVTDINRDGRVEVFTAPGALVNGFLVTTALVDDATPAPVNQGLLNVLTDFGQPYGNLPMGMFVAAGGLSFNSGVSAPPGGIPGPIIIGPGPGPDPDPDPDDPDDPDPGTSTILSVGGALTWSAQPYGATFQGGVHVAKADVNGDGTADVITAPGPGAPPLVRVFDGATGLPLAGPLGSLMAYSENFLGGVWVAAGDVDGDGYADVVTGAGPGGGPHVKVFSGWNGALLKDFFAYNRFFRGGVRVAVGDIDGDYYAEIITGAGPGGGPHVKVYSGANYQVIGSFFPYGIGFTGGVNVAAADTNGDGYYEVVTAADAGGGSHVKVFASANGTNVRRDFFAYEYNFTGGVRVAAGDLDGDGRDDLLLSAATGAAGRVKALSAGNPADNITSSLPAALRNAAPGFFAIGPGLQGQPLRAAEGAIAAGGAAAALGESDLAGVFDSAVAAWVMLDPRVADLVAGVSVEIVDLAGDKVGLRSGLKIYLDVDAAGHGWFVDDTPADSSEFSLVAADGLYAAAGTAAAARIDLLTVVAHELGHVLGLVDLDEHDDQGDVMTALLGVGVRRLPDAETLDAVFSE